MMIEIDEDDIDRWVVLASNYSVWLSENPNPELDTEIDKETREQATGFLRLWYLAQADGLVEVEIH